MKYEIIEVKNIPSNNGKLARQAVRTVAVVDGAFAWALLWFRNKTAPEGTKYYAVEY